MNIQIDYAKRVPIYLQIVNEVERLVSLNILKSGDAIPSIRELACMLAINPNTVKKAYDTLITKKVIVSKSTKGCFITENVSIAKKEKINNIIKEINIKIKELENYGYTKEEVLDKIK